MGRDRLREKGQNGIERRRGKDQLNSDDELENSG
jgi:hypothetical protein